MPRWVNDFMISSVVTVTVTQKVKAEVKQAQGVRRADMGMVGVRHFAGVDDGDSAFANDRNKAISFKHGAGVFIDADAHSIGVRGNGGE